VTSNGAQSRRHVGSPRCVVADDQPALYDVISAYFSVWGIDVVEVAGDGDEAVAAVEAHQPEALVLNLGLRGGDGLEVLARCADASPCTGIVVYSECSDPSAMARAVRYGARGFVSKEAPLDELARAVGAAAAGESYIDPRLNGVMLEAAASARLEWGAA